MKYAVVYTNGNESKYVGSLSDYKCGEFSADPILMSEEDANELLYELDKYVRKEEFADCTDRDAALHSYYNSEWGFNVEELDIDNLEYMGALVCTNGDPMLIEDEEQAALVAHAADKYGLDEIKHGSEDFEVAMKRLDMTYANRPKHIYRAGEYTICKGEDWDLVIETLQGLADYINSEDYNQLEVNRIIEANGWTDLCGENDYDVCEYNGQKVTLDENTGKAIVVCD